MSTLGEINEEILWRKSRAAILQAVLQHLDAFYVSNDAGEAELRLTHEDGGLVTEKHIARFMDDIASSFEAEVDELDRICGADVPELKKLLLPPEPEPEPDPEPEDGEEADDEADGSDSDEAEDEDPGEEAEGEEEESEDGSGPESDEVEDEQEGEEDEPSARAS